ncbi:hypothetical protein DFH07DRAFT_762505 [Mycena maculata]|uniref:Ricin B lectin domain-containing protein n=1 Tax=Mycena maculata TaxID=230809 RepID=A0AAD7MG98_9AGAR|nr:hypothetical protein DFH07DRAFT_762505 [Mycena maculata]
MLASTLFTLLATGLATAVPLGIRDVSLDPAATAQAQVKDNTATRAFTATTITTSDGQCLSIDPFSGDFRENLTPINAVACDGSANQTWDVITAGVHNNIPGQALIVSSLTNACLNFDPRRAAGNQVLLFSCGGRADGSGAVATSQLFSFVGGSGPLPLLPQNGNNATCLTINGNNALDQTACNAATASGAELFTFGGSAASSSDTAAATTDASTSTTSTVEAASATSVADCVATTVTETVTVTVTDSLSATNSQAKDLTAIRAATSVEIKTSTGDCLFVDPTAGDFRENLIPITIKACDGSPNQQWDFITAGVHNNVADSTLIVSSLTQGCMNFDPRRAAGDQVILFSCGGRADGSGQVTNSQLFPFTSANLTAPYALTPENGPGVCFINDNGRLSNTDCSPDATELFTIGSSSVSSSTVTSVPAATSTTIVATTSTAAAEVSSSTSGASSSTVATTTTKVEDATTTSATATISSSDGQCLSVDATAGDFRENLIPIAVTACDGSEGQKFDFITAGVHNNVANSTLIVSSLTQGCFNFDSRRAAGDQVIIFSCGGRADGSGQVTNSQLFPFTAANLTAPYALTPENGPGVCFINDNGRLSNTDCNTASPDATQVRFFSSHYHVSRC